MEIPSSDRTAIYTLAGVIAAATIAFLGSQWARTAFDATLNWPRSADGRRPRD
jgi:hypothetical protein